MKTFYDKEQFTSDSELIYTTIMPRMNMEQNNQIFNQLCYTPGKKTGAKLTKISKNDDKNCQVYPSLLSQ